MELGKPQSIIQREGEPITELIHTHILIEELNEQLLLYSVSQQRELLKAFLDWQQNKYRKPYDVSPKEQIEDWEAFNCG